MMDGRYLSKGAARSLGPIQIIPCQGNGVLAFGELKLENVVDAVPERQFTAHEVKVPHTYKALIIERFGLVCPREKT